MVKIRLTRMGTKKRPFYRVVVAHDRVRREGPFIEIIGTYNPQKGPEETKKELKIVNKCYTVDATKISFDIIGRGIAFNTAMLGALIKVRPIVSVDSLSGSLLKTFGKDIGQRNVEVMLRANKEVTGL